MKITDIRVNVPLVPFCWTAGLYGGAPTTRPLKLRGSALIQAHPRPR
ncbi:hypothetical protein [Mesorhizobium waimense]|nr:hypothetical protein [Mesorhizobium waimense]